ncbi:MAG: hypothetical protein AAB383_01015 [Patescibacteria group bacterium]|jgi:hypothetical protein
MKGLQKIHKEPLQWLYTLALAMTIFYGYYQVMKILPAVGKVPACVVGGSLTIKNVVFSGLLSVLTALILAGLVRLYLLRKSIVKSTKTGSILGFGFLTGFFTIFCTLCTIPLISIFGFSVGLGFFTTYNLFFKILSLIFMLTALVLLNKQLGDCKSCIKYPQGVFSSIYEKRHKIQSHTKTKNH